MRIRRTITTLTVTAMLGGTALMTPVAAMSARPGGGGGGGGGTWAPLPQGPCSPGGIWHPDPGGNGMAGWCEYPKKKKCWWTCPHNMSAAPDPSILGVR
jgi:hypothetical protein